MRWVLHGRGVFGGEGGGTAMDQQLKKNYFLQKSQQAKSRTPLSLQTFRKRRGLSTATVSLILAAKVGRRRESSSTTPFTFSDFHFHTGTTASQIIRILTLVPISNVYFGTHIGSPVPDRRSKLITNRKLKLGLLIGWLLIVDCTKHILFNPGLHKVVPVHRWS